MAWIETSRSGSLLVADGVARNTGSEVLFLEGLQFSLLDGNGDRVPGAAHSLGSPLPEEMREDPGAEPDAGQMLAIDQEAGKLRQALLQLKGDQRDMIEKAYMGEMTHQEISNQTGLPLGTIKSRIRLGLERLRYELKEMR